MPKKTPTPRDNVSETKFSGTGAVELIRGDALETLKALAETGRTFDALVTDPPYCSGGVTPAERRRSPNSKYFETKSVAFDDGLDQISLWETTRAWLVAARRVLAPIGYVAIFCDWRQIPVFSSAFQSAGLFWRGVAVWDKGNARPNRGQFKPVCEFLIWGTATWEKSDKFGNGLFRLPPDPATRRYHPAQKPVALIKQILAILPDKARAVLDPFCGSASTGIAAREMGLDFTGIEISEHYYKIARDRLDGNGAAPIMNLSVESLP